MEPDKQEFLAWATVFATFVGPIVAVFATRVIDRLREKRDAKLNVFRALMRNRRLSLSQDFVSALNSVEVEFYGDKSVISALEELSQHYNKNIQLEPQRWEQERQYKLAKLLRVMGRSLGIEIEQLDILSGGYAPQGWDETETQQKIARALLIEVLSGHKPINVTLTPILQQQEQSAPRNDEGKV
ncbi:hypothetical protein AZL_009500 [Azospirillum sp. B510]|nr:hypothetical protein AZL_009500 [Azospirillum sp. B510]